MLCGSAGGLARSGPEGGEIVVEGQMTGRGPMILLGSEKLG
jgi:hypothetical protein